MHLCCVFPKVPYMMYVKAIHKGNDKWGIIWLEYCLCMDPVLTSDVVNQCLLVY